MAAVEKTSLRTSKGLGLYQVKTQIGNSCENEWMITIDGVMIEHVFGSYNEAKAEIMEHLEDVEDEHSGGNLAGCSFEEVQDQFPISEIQSLDELSGVCSLMLALEKVPDVCIFDRVEICQNTKRCITFLVSKAYVKEVEGSKDILNAISGDVPNVNFLYALKFLEQKRYDNKMVGLFRDHQDAFEKRIYPCIKAVLSLAFL